MRRTFRASLTDLPVSAEWTGIRVAISLRALDYEHLAAIELDQASRCELDGSRVRHLDRAAVYAHLAEKAEAGSAQPGEVLVLITELSAALDDADTLGLTMAAIHINDAVISLGGVATAPA